MTEMVTRARLEADGNNLIGQLSKAEIAARGLEGALEGAAGGGQALSSATEQLRSRLDPMYAAQRRFDSELETANRLMTAGTITTREFAAANELARTNLRAHSDALHGLNGATQQSTANLAAQRAGYQQLGFQMQDVFQQAALGINPLVILAQQGGQTASAIALMGNAAGGTQSKFVRFATFLSGPWGAAIFGATTILGFMVQSLLSASDASEDAASSSETLADKLDLTKHSFDEVIAAAREYNAEKRKGIELDLSAAQAAANAAQKNYDVAISLRDRLKAQLDLYQAEVMAGPTGLNGQGQIGAAVGAAFSRDRLAQIDGEIAALEDARDNARSDLADVRAQLATDAEYALRESFKKRRAELADTITDVDNLTEAYTRLRREEKQAFDNLRASERSGRLSGSVTGSQASNLGQMTNLLRELFPGVRITSTTGGKHTKGSDHYSGRAIDFVPAGGMGAYSTAEVERILEEAGVKIRHGSKGTKQVFGPGRSAKREGDHDDHFHFAWDGGAPNQTRQADRLGKFGDSAQEKVERLLGSYDAAPRGIDKALADIREMDKLIAELGQRKPPGFEATIASAEKAKVAIQGGIGEQIADIADRFSEIPKGASDAQMALADIAAIGDALREANPPDLDLLLDQLRVAKGAVEESLNRPFRELLQESERRQKIDLLILAGRETEARTLEEIWRLERELGPLSEERRREVEGIVLAEEQHLDRLEKAQRLQSAYLVTTQSVRGELEAIFAGKGDLKNFGQIFKDLKARVMVEQIFGPALDAFDDYVKENTAIDRAVEEFAQDTNRAGDAAEALADSLFGAAARIADPQVGGASWLGDFDAAFPGASTSEAGQAGAEIVVTAPSDVSDVSEGIEKSNSVMGMTPERYFEQLTKQMTAPLLEQLDGMFGVEFFGQLQGAISGYLYGSATGGGVGGLMGLGKGLIDQFGLDLFGWRAGGISDIFDKGLKGAQTGTMVSGLADVLGLKMSGSGAQVGGTIGSFLPIPGGEILGSIAGGLLGGLFKKKPYGTATLGSGSLSASGKQADIASGLGGSVQGGLDSIIEALGGELGDYSVSIGTYNDSFRVSTKGQSGKLSGNSKSEARNEREQGLYRFTDEAEAIAFAIADAIGDGAVKGISEKMQQALKSSTDIDEAVAEALKVREIEELLSGMADDYAEELRAFERVASERLRIGEKYGFDLVELEKVNAEERAEIFDSIMAERVGSLKQLLEDLTFGDLAEGTLSERRQRLLGEIAKAEEEAASGKDGAADRLAALNRQLIDLSREAFGTAGGEYGSDRDQAIASAERIIALEEERLQAERSEVTGRLDEGNRLTNETNDLLAGIRAGIERLGLAPGGLGYPLPGGGSFDTTREVVR